MDHPALLAGGRVGWGLGATFGKELFDGAPLE